VDAIRAKSLYLGTMDLDQNRQASLAAVAAKECWYLCWYAELLDDH
jgi:hypothetical protein